MMLRLAVAPAIQRPTRSSAKSKPNESVLVVSGNQTGPHPRAHLGIPLWRRMRLSMESPTGESRACRELELPRRIR